MHQAFAKRVIGTTTVVAVGIAVVDYCLRHHYFLRHSTLVVRFGLQRLLRALGGRVPRVVGAEAELLLAVRVATRTAVAARSVVAPEVGAEAGLPQWMQQTVFDDAVVPLPFRGRNDIVFSIEFNLFRSRLMRFRSGIVAVGWV